MFTVGCTLGKRPAARGRDRVEDAKGSSGSEARRGSNATGSREAGGGREAVNIHSRILVTQEASSGGKPGGKPGGKRTYGR